MSAERSRTTNEQRQHDESGAPRRVTLLVKVLLAFESSLYGVLAPVLPHYAAALGASKPAVGVLAAAYTAGLIPGSVLGGWMAARVGCAAPRSSGWRRSRGRSRPSGSAATS